MAKPCDNDACFEIIRDDYTYCDDCTEEAGQELAERFVDQEDEPRVLPDLVALMERPSPFGVEPPKAVTDTFAAGLTWRERAELPRADPKNKKKKIAGDPRRRPVDWHPQTMAQCRADLEEVFGPLSQRQGEMMFQA